MRFKKICMAAGCIVSLNVVAGTMGDMADACHPWSVMGAIGYTQYEHAYHGGVTADPLAQSAIGDGQTPFGRFAIARELGMYNVLNFGVELGVQSGNIMRLGVPQATLDLLDGLPIQLNVKPMLDLLATAKFQALSPSVWNSTPVFAAVKAGIAYRRLQINERVTVNDLSQVGFEVQGGLGVSISERAELSVMYQGVFNNSTRFTVNPLLSIGHISNIPSQNGVLLNLSYAV